MNRDFPFDFFLKENGKGEKPHNIRKNLSSDPEAQISSSTPEREKEKEKVSENKATNDVFEQNVKAQSKQDHIDFFLKIPSKDPSQISLPLTLSYPEKAPEPQPATKKSQKNSNNSQTLANNSETTITQSEASSSEFDSAELEEINNATLTYLSTLISPQKFHAYFQNTFALITIQKDRVLFSTQTSFIKTMILKQFSAEIQEALTQVLGKTYQIDITVAETKLTPNSPSDNLLHQHQNKGKSTSKYREKVTQESSVSDLLKPLQSFDPYEVRVHESKEDKYSAIESQYISHVTPSNSGTILIDPLKTFDNLVIGPSNHMAIASAKAIVKSPGSSGKYPSLYLYSSSGLGKTHILHAVANGIKNLHPELTICLITAREFTDKMIQFVLNNNYSQFKNYFTEKTDVLMIDDIHILKKTDAVQDNFFHIFNELHNKGKQLIFTSDKHPREIDGIEERIKTRLQWGLVVDIQKPDYETRIAILKNRAAQLDLYLQDEVFELLARSVTSSIRELEGCLVKLCAFHEHMKADLDTDIVRELLKLAKKGEAEEGLNIDTIARATSRYYNVHLADLKSKGRSKGYTKARHISMFMAHKLLGITLTEIGEYFGNRDHATVLSAIRRVDSQQKNDPELGKDMISIEQTFLS